MQGNWEVLRAMLYCPYKAWLLEKGRSDDLGQGHIESSGIRASVVVPVRKFSPDWNQTVNENWPNFYLPVKRGIKV